MGEKEYTLKEWCVLWFLYNSKKDYRQTPKSLGELERDMGYTKNQCGGIRKFLQYLIKNSVLIKKQVFKVDTIKRYIINKKRIDEIIVDKKLFQIIVCLDYGEIKYNNIDIPLPAKI